MKYLADMKGETIGIQYEFILRPCDVQLVPCLLALSHVHIALQSCFFANDFSTVKKKERKKERERGKRTKRERERGKRIIHQNDDDIRQE